MSKSEQFLKEAFAGESQANRRYLAFAEKADQEGHHRAAKLFRAAARRETVHRLMRLRRSTRTILKEPSRTWTKSKRFNISSARSAEMYSKTQFRTIAPSARP